MTTITKTVEIPEDRRIHLVFDVPETLPTGPAELQVTINPAVPPRKPLAGLFGILRGKNAFEADGVILQRQWRDEWSS